MDDKVNNNKEEKRKRNENVGVSDREIMNIIKEENIFPQTFTKRIKLSVLVKFYQKYWNHDFTDEESDTDEQSF